MRFPRRILVALSACVIALSLTPSAQAVLATRVFMSTTGNDSNNCANPNTPCLTFAGSLAKVAVGGEVIAEATGGYGAINVTQSVTISGPPGVVIYSGLTVTVNAPGATVVLRGLTIDGTGATGNGVNVLAVAILHVESCVITGFAGSYPNGNGILFTAAGQLFVNDTIIRGNGEAGIWVTPVSGTAQASVDRCRLEQNVLGLVSDGASGIAQVTMKDSAVSGNLNTGLWAVSGGEVNAEGCLVANNLFGLVSSVTGTIFRVSNCTIADNDTGLFPNLGSLLSRSNNTVQGNTTKGSFTGTFTAD